jgi:sugar phosphate isomerase/epimerase
MTDLSDSPRSAAVRLFDGLGPGAESTTSPQSLATALEALAHIGATGTQLTANGWDVVRNGRVATDRLARFRKVAEGFGLRYTLHTPIAELNLMAPDPHFQEQQFRSWLEVAAAMGCRSATYHPGRFDPAMHPGGDPQALLAGERDALARLAEVAATLDVIIACENLVTQAWWAPAHRQYSCVPDWLVDLVTGIDHPSLGICFDLGHLALSAAVEGYDYGAAARLLAPHAVVLHVHDNFAKPTVAPSSVGGVGPAMQLIRGEGDLHLPPGWGSVPLDETFSAGGFNRRPIFILEVDVRYWRDDPEVARESVVAGNKLAALAAGVATVV